MPGKTMLIRMTEPQHATVARAAKEAGLSLSRYTVARLLGDRPEAPAEVLKEAERALENALQELRRGVKEEIHNGSRPSSMTGYLTRSGIYVKGAPPAHLLSKKGRVIPEGSSGVEEFVKERCSPELGATVQCVTGEELACEFYQWASTRSGVERLTPQQVKVRITRLLGAQSKVYRRGTTFERSYKIPLLRTT